MSSYDSVSINPYCICVYWRNTNIWFYFHWKNQPRRPYCLASFSVGSKVKVVEDSSGFHKMVNIGHICMAKKRDWTRMYVGYFAYSLGQTSIRWRRCVNMKKYKMLFICNRNLVTMQNTPYHAQWTPIIKCRKKTFLRKIFNAAPWVALNIWIAKHLKLEHITFLIKLLSNCHWITAITWNLNWCDNGWSMNK